MNNVLPYLTAALAAMGVGLLVFTLLARFGSADRGGKGEPAPWPERLRPTLDLVPVPGALRGRWATAANVQRMRYADLAWDGAQYAAARWLSLWSFGALGAFFAFSRAGDLIGLFMAGLSISVGLAGPDVWINWRIERRQREIEISLPDFLDRLALGLEAGLGFELALRRTAVNFPGLLGEGLRRVVGQLDRGHAREDALTRLTEENPSTDLNAFAAAVRQADRLGTSLSKTLRVQTALLRSRRRRRAEEAGRRLPILIAFPLVFFFLPALLIIYLAPPILHLFLAR